MDKLKNIVNPGHSEVDDLLYDTGSSKKHGHESSGVANPNTVESTTNKPGVDSAAPYTKPADMDPTHQDVERHQHAHNPAHGTAAAGTTTKENEDPSKPKKEGGLLDKILHPSGHKDKPAHDETTTSKIDSQPATSEHHGRHAAEGVAAGGGAAELAAHEKRKHDQKAAERDLPTRTAESTTPAAAVAGKHTPAEEKHDTTAGEKKPSIIQKILHPGSGKTDKDAAETATGTEEHHHGRDAALGAGAAGAAGAAAHHHHKHDERQNEPTTGSTAQSKAEAPQTGLFGAQNSAMGSGPGGIAGPAYAASRDPATRPDEPSDYTGPRAGDEPRARFGAKDAALGTGAGGVAGPAYASGKEQSANAGEEPQYHGPRAGDEYRHGRGAKDAALGVGAAGGLGLAYRESKQHDNDKHDTHHTDSAEKKHSKAEEKEGKPSLISRILHPSGSKTEKENEDHAAKPKEHHHHGTEAATAGAFGAHEHKKHEHKKDEPVKEHHHHGTEAAAAGAFGAHEHKKHEHKKDEPVKEHHHRDTPAHQHATTGAAPASTTGPTTSQYTPAAPAVARGEPLSGSSHQATGVPPTSAIDTSAPAGQHHYGRDAAVGGGALGAAGAAYAAHEHNKSNVGHPVQGLGNTGASDTTGHADSQAYSRQEQPASSQPSGIREAHSAAPAGAAAAYGSHDPGQENKLSHHVHNTVTGAHGKDAPHHHFSGQGHSSSAQDQDRTHYGRDAAVGGGAAAAAASAAYGAHHHHDHDHGNKDELSHHIHNSVTGAGSPSSPVARQAASAAYPTQQPPTGSQTQPSGAISGNNAPTAPMGSQGAGNAAYSSRDAPTQPAQTSSNVPPTAIGTDQQHHYGRDAALGAGAVGAGGLAAHEHKKHHEDPTKATQPTPVATETKHHHAREEKHHAKEEKHHHDDKEKTSGGLAGLLHRDKKEDKHDKHDKHEKAAEATHPTKTEEEKKHHHGRDAALGAGAAGAAGTAAHEHKKHHEEEEVAGEKKKSTVSKIMDKILHPGKSKEQKEDTSPEHSRELKPGQAGPTVVPGATDRRGSNVPVSEHSLQDRALPGEEGRVGHQILGGASTGVGHKSASKEHSPHRNSKDPRVVGAVASAHPSSHHGTHEPASSTEQKLHTDPDKKEHGILRQILNPGNDKADSTRFGTTASTEKPHEHHTGRDAALGAGAVGAGAAAYEHQQHKHEGVAGETPPTRSDTTDTTGSQTGPATKTQGPHKSNIANILDPRVTPNFEAQREHKEERKVEQGGLSSTTTPVAGATSTAAGASTAAGTSTDSSPSGMTSGTIAPHNTTVNEPKKYPGVPEAKHPAAIGEGSDNRSDNPYTSKPVDPRLNMPGSYQ